MSKFKVGDRARIARWGTTGFAHNFDETIGTEGYIDEISPNGATVLKTDKGIRYGDISGLDPIPDEPAKDPFAPGEYVTLTGIGWGIRKGDTIICGPEHARNPLEYFTSSHANNPMDIQGLFGYMKSNFRPATIEEIAAYKEKYEPECAVGTESEPRITFTVGGQEFYVGQRVWSLVEVVNIIKGAELEILGLNGNRLCVRVPGTSIMTHAATWNISTIPPTPHEWKRGDWARHEKKGVVFVAGKSTYGNGSLFVADENGHGDHISPTELTFISHSEPPK